MRSRHGDLRACGSVVAIYFSAVGAAVSATVIIISRFSLPMGETGLIVVAYPGAEILRLISVKSTGSYRNTGSPKPRRQAITHEVSPSNMRFVERLQCRSHMATVSL